jgi:hypothetical protein
VASDRVVAIAGAIVLEIKIDFSEVLALADDLAASSRATRTTWP